MDTLKHLKRNLLLCKGGKHVPSLKQGIAVMQHIIYMHIIYAYIYIYIYIYAIIYAAYINDIYIYLYIFIYIYIYIHVYID